MKTLYVGCYRDGTGYAKAAVDYILALDAAGVDVACRPLKLNAHDAPGELPPRVLELEAKSSRGCDTVIQHTLPHLMDYQGGLRNVALFAAETSDFRASCWADRLDLMDEAWAICREQLSACRASGVTAPLRVVPHACDTAAFTRSHAPLPELARAKESGEFVFYWVGELVRRKNLCAVLRAFHAEFDYYEPVRLAVKASVPGAGPDEALAKTRAFCDDIWRNLKLPEPRKPELLITRRLGEAEVLSLHATADCFVTASYGESWCIPAFTAMAMGKTPIAPAWGGFLDYLSDECGYLVPAREEPVFGSTDSLGDLYTGAETWGAVDILALRRAMRLAFEGGDSGRKEKAIRGIDRAFDFSHQRVGELMRGLLYGQQRQELAAGAGRGPGSDGPPGETPAEDS